MNHYVHYLSHDAPAIATADVGIAMGGRYRPMETADVILMADILDKLPYALNLAKATVRNMKQNMFLAVGTVFILLAGVLTKNVNSGIRNFGPRTERVAGYPECNPFGNGIGRGLFLV